MSLISIKKDRAMERLRRRLIQLIEWSPDWVFTGVGHAMRFSMMYCAGLFTVLFFTGDLAMLAEHLWGNRLHSEPVAIALASYLLLVAAMILQFKRAYEMCREVLAVRRFQRTGIPPYLA
jgi:hypothetical protein